MSMFEIEKDVPLPERNYGNPRKYPFAEMEVGDSFVVSPYRAFNIARAAAHKFGVAQRKKFQTRKDGDGGRIWRVS